MCIRAVFHAHNDAARFGALGFAVVIELESALLDDDHFQVLDAVRGAGDSPGGLHGLLHGHGFAGECAGRLPD